MDALPNLPGFKVQDGAEDYRRKLAFEMVDGVRMELAAENPRHRPKMVQVPRHEKQRRDGSLPQSTSHAIHRKLVSQPDYELLPAHEALSGQVLRFFGFFTENVVDSNLETSRVRPCVLLYYLEDDTVQLNEPLKQNSGIPQGTLIKRCPATDIRLPALCQLCIGTIVTLRGMAVTLTDADTFTRNYFSREFSAKLSACLPLPSDTFTSLADSIPQDHHLHKNLEKLHREASLGAASPHPKMRQWLENDRKVARFFAVLDETENAKVVERRPFVVLYFMADDTIQVREEYSPNCGREEFSVFIKRTKIPRAGASVVNGPYRQALMTNQFVQLKDLAVGNSIDILGRKFLIHDADGFTRRFFEESLGKPLQPKLEIALRPPNPVKAVNPPPTGYGSEEDSLGSVRSIVPKPPRAHPIDPAIDGKSLKCLAEHNGRKFIVTFYLADNTLTIQEPAQRNSGIIPGRFLERSEYVNELTGERVKPRDLLQGNSLKILGRILKVEENDEFTRRYFQTGSVAPVHVDLRAVVNRLRALVDRQVCRTAAHGAVPQVIKWLEKFGLGKHEAVALMTVLDEDRDGLVSFGDFCRVLYSNEEIQKTEGIDECYQQLVSSVADESKKNEAAKVMLIRIQDLMLQKTGTERKLMVQLGELASGQKVTSKDIYKVLMANACLGNQETVDLACKMVIPGVDLDRVDYVAFVRGAKLQ